MKRLSRFLPFVLMIATLLLSACGAVAATATPNAGGGRAEPIPVAFIGTVDSIAGDQWVINSQTVTVAPDVIRNGPFGVGDQVKVEGVVNADGSFTVSRVESPTPQDTSTLPQFGNDNSNSNTNDANVNDANVNDANINADNSNGANTNGDNSNSANTNDDNGNDANTNDDNGNDDNGNDDNGNDDNGNDDNGNDNSDDSNGNDDDSGSGGNDDDGGRNDNGGNDDNGGGGDDNSND